MTFFLNLTFSTATAPGAEGAESPYAGVLLTLRDCCHKIGADIPVLKNFF